MQKPQNFMLLSIYMAESAVNKRIREAYEATSGSKVEVLALVNKGKDKTDKKDKKRQKQNKHRASEAMVSGEQAHTKDKQKLLTHTLPQSPCTRFR